VRGLRRLLDWHISGVLLPTFIGVGIAFLSMTPADFVVAKISFGAAALLLAAKAVEWALWAETQKRTRWALGFLALVLVVFGWMSVLRWTDARASYVASMLTASPPASSEKSAAIGMVEGKVSKAEKTRLILISLAMKNFGDAVAVVDISVSAAIDGVEMELSSTDFPGKMTFFPGQVQSLGLSHWYSVENFRGIFSGRKRLDIKVEASYETRPGQKAHLTFVGTVDPLTNRIQTIRDETS